MNKHLHIVVCMLVALLATAVPTQVGAQDVTATWDFKNKIPAEAGAAAIQGNTGEVASNVDGVSLFVDATNGKFNSKDRDGDVQVNEGTVIRVPVKSARDIVKVTPSPNYGFFTLGGEQADLTNPTEHKATVAEAEAGHVDIVATDGCYLWEISVTFVSEMQSREIYSTSFTEWPEIDRKKNTADPTTHEVATKYSNERLTFTFCGAGVDPDGTQSKFTDLEDLGLGYIITGKYKSELGEAAEPYVETSPLKSLSKIELTQAATGGNRGIKVSVKGDGDTDWVVLHDKSIGNSKGETLTLQVNRENCKIKLENYSGGLDQNAYVTDLALYSLVDMSQYPALGSFAFNGVTYQAVDVFTETAEGVQEAVIEIENAVQLPSADNPITSISCDNGDVDGDVAYEKQDEHTVLVTIKVTANGETMTYKTTFKHKPYFTLTYLDTDGKTVINNTQKVEKDAKIGTLDDGANVTVPEGKAFRGWFVEADGGRKYNVEDIVTSDITLYAVATDIETESATARYTFNLTDEYFYDEDHEAFNAEGAAWHDGQHGWTLEKEGKIDLLVGGHAYIIATLCKYSKADAVMTLSDTGGNPVATANGYSDTDGKTVMMEYTGGAGTLTLTTSNEVYLHKITIMNVEGSPITPNEQGYYVVRRGDGLALLNTIDIANAQASADRRTYIFLPDGTYDLGHTTLTPISGDNISLIGQSMDNTIIVNEAEEEGIGVSATLLVTGNNTYMQDLTIKNAYDYYQPGFAGRAVVLQDKGNRTICKNVRMLSYQDTYYSNNNDAQFYFEDSDIHGTVDFICGGGDVFFNRCTLTVEPRNADGSGECTITAPTTETEYGYVFNECTIDSKAEKFNYGRAWQNKARCAYLNTTLLQPERLNENRWTLGGMNVPADRFVEYNTMDKDGKMISPESLVLTFTKDNKKNTFETILTEEEAKNFALDKVFTNWTPAEYTGQKALGVLRCEGENRLAWDAVEGATAYAIFNGDRFVGMTTSTSYEITEGDIKNYSVRAANEHGGFGEASSTTSTGIDRIDGTSGGEAVSIAYYSVQGERVSSTYRGLVIEVQTMADGSKTVRKMIRK